MTYLVKGAALTGALVAFASTASALTITTAAASCDPAAQASALDAGFDGFGDFACGTTADRQNVGNVNLGAADGKFFSLGLVGGVALFEISAPFTGPSTIIEVTNRSSHYEAADVFVGLSVADLLANITAGNSVGRVNNGMGGNSAAVNEVAISGAWTWIAFADASYDEYGDAAAGNLTVDGYDLDSFTVQPVPVPAAALMLGTALAGLGFARRRA